MLMPRSIIPSRTSKDWLGTKVGFALAIVFWSVAAIGHAGAHLYTGPAIPSLATREARPVETLLFALGLSAAAVLLFVKALALPVPIWPGAWF